VNVQVVHGLARPGAVVDYGPVTFGVEMPLPGKLGRNHEEPAEERGVFGGGVLEGSQVFARDDEQVHGCLRVLVLKCDHVAVLKYDFGGCFALNYSAEDAVAHALLPD